LISWLIRLSGLFYTFIQAPKDARVARWAKENNPKGLFDAEEPKEWLTPLIYEPGTSYIYSTGIDWAGVLVERISGQSLEEYFQEKMFKPLGLKDTTFIPRDDIRERLMKVRARPAGGDLIALPGKAVGKPDTEAELKLHSGGGGLFGTSREYLLFLQNILACSRKNPNPPSFRLIKPETYELLFAPAMPPLSDDTDCLTKLVEFTGRSGFMKPPPTPDNVQHSLGLFLHLADSEHGRLTGSGAWSGMAKTMVGHALAEVQPVEAEFLSLTLVLAGPC
jgi:methyl acetate hydrolase